MLCVTYTRTYFRIQGDGLQAVVYTYDPSLSRACYRRSNGVGSSEIFILCHIEKELYVAFYCLNKLLL